MSQGTPAMSLKLVGTPRAPENASRRRPWTDAHSKRESRSSITASSSTVGSAIPAGPPPLRREAPPKMGLREKILGGPRGTPVPGRA